MSTQARRDTGDPPGSAANGQGLLREGENCWKIAKADRVAFLVDAAAYFDAFAAATSRARHSILILGWDMDRRERLWRDDRESDLPSQLGSYLDALVRRRRSLHVHALVWDFAMVYALERNLFPVFHLGWRTHGRFHFCLDADHPAGASHHQKVVVVDDKLAFVGGIDLSKWRWDTPEHRPDEPGRVDPNGQRYPPFHDVQVMVEGDVVTALGELARERWHRATSQRLKPPPTTRANLWPGTQAPDLESVPIAIARTEPAYRGRQEVREVERLYLDAIAAAKKHIYIENQYFTSGVVGEAIAARLAEPDGPEVVVVMPEHTGGWLEQNTMDVLRARLLRRFQNSEDKQRFRVLFPTMPGLADGCISVHAKVLVTDDRLLRIGSSNLSNRSMGLDTECDLALDAGGDERVAQAIARFRSRLLGEHLGVRPESVSERLVENGSLIQTLESLRHEGRTLKDLAADITQAQETLVPDGALLDPERPIEPERLVGQYLPEEVQPRGRQRMARFLVFLGALLALAALWRWTPLSTWVSPESIAAWLEHVQNPVLQLGLVIAGFVLGGFVMLPVTILVIATAVTFGPWMGFPYAMLGALSSAVATYGAGELLGRDAVRRLAGSRINRISKKLATQGMLTIVTLRIVPVAPFSVINLVAGASHIRFKDFLLGTVVGLAPGTLLLSMFATSLYRSLFDPTPQHLLILAVALVVLVGGTVLLRRWVGSRRS